MKIYLVRHGETDWNVQRRFQGREDIPLNENGASQARACGQALGSARIQADLMLSSPLKRAMETAEIIAPFVGSPPIQKEADLIERDYGRFSGLDYRERKTFLDGGGVEDIEPWEDLARRIMKVLRTCAQRENSGDILMVSHGGILNAAFAVLSNHEVGTGKTRLKNACINVVDCREGNLILEKYNLSPEEFSAAYST